MKMILMTCALLAMFLLPPSAYADCDSQGTPTGSGHAAQAALGKDVKAATRELGAPLKYCQTRSLGMLFTEEGTGPARLVRASVLDSCLAFSGALERDCRRGVSCGGWAHYRCQTAGGPGRGYAYFGDEDTLAVARDLALGLCGKYETGPRERCSANLTCEWVIQ